MKRIFQALLGLPLLLGSGLIAEDGSLTGEPVPAEASSSAPTPETQAAPASASAPAASARVSTLPSSEIADFSAQPPAVQRLLAAALALTTRNLTYTYGSDDPSTGGMDCSGTVYYLLAQAGLKDVPRDSAGMYQWVWTKGIFHAVAGVKEDTFELEKLHPGDLLFWTGTYKIDRDPPVTHVMIYLGRDKQTGHRVMVGASDGRTFNGKSRYGVSVFDFKMPGADAGKHFAPEAQASTTTRTRFIGYGAPPGLAESASGP